MASDSEIAIEDVRDLDFAVEQLGVPELPSPVRNADFVAPAARITLCRDADAIERFVRGGGRLPAFEKAGPRERIYHDPAWTRVAIVTCGGLCPGINDVIRAIVMELYHRYCVTNIIGIRYGFQGLVPRYGHPVVELSPEGVKDIHTLGGSILSSSRGNQDPEEMVDALKRMNIDILFCIGGDGTMRATELITEEINRRKLEISVIGIPKTIDNDLNLVDKTFGFDTAISEAIHAIQCAHVEAKGAPMGIGLVKLMGRQSGHIAVHAALAQNDANFVLIPEVPFDLHGERGFLKTLELRLRSRGHCVILVAEGAGQEFFFHEKDKIETDASGNLKLSDIGIYLKCAIEEYFQTGNLKINLKYIDPSYMIRSVPANASDSIYCGALGQYAVHAGMCGKTGMLVGRFRGEYVHLPLQVVMSGKKVDPAGNIWMRVIESTGQPLVMKNEF